jgi:hypothetical protein
LQLKSAPPRHRGSHDRPSGNERSKDSQNLGNNQGITQSAGDPWVAPTVNPSLVPTLCVGTYIPALCAATGRDAERPHMRSAAERRNEGKRRESRAQPGARRDKNEKTPADDNRGLRITGDTWVAPTSANGAQPVGAAFRLRSAT